MTIASQIPAIARGRVWCTVCGRSRLVDGAQCLSRGWPKCCGYTMTIDSPHERLARRALRDASGRFTAREPQNTPDTTQRPAGRPETGTVEAS